MRSDMIKLGVDKAPQRAMLKGMGYINEEIANPFIGVISSNNEISPGHRHLRELVQAVKDGIRLAGGTPVEINAVSVCDGIALGHTGVNYALASREIVADTVETIIGAHGFDAVVLIPNCEKVVAGMLIGAVRADIPSILVSGGAAQPGYLEGNQIDLASIFERVEGIKAGKENSNNLAEMEENACPGCGACAGMPNAHSMSLAAEALGMALPNSTTCAAGHAQLIRLAKRAGLKIMELLLTNLRPSQVISLKSLRNAIAVDAAMGGSPSVLLHLRAIAYELGITIDQTMVNSIYDSVPVLCRLRPDSNWQVNDLHAAGGLPALMALLDKKDLLDTGVPVVAGKTLRQVIPTGISDKAEIFKQYQQRSGLMAITGNLAPEGAILTWKGATIPNSVSGPARVFDSAKDAEEGIKAGKILPGNIIVIRYEGPRGGPGMQELAAPQTELSLHSACRQTAIVTDGRFSGWFTGLAVQHVSPEAAAGGPLANVLDGDLIIIDPVSRSIDICISQQELAKRAKNWASPAPKVKSGYLAKYARHVSSAAAGAVTR